MSDADMFLRVIFMLEYDTACTPTDHKCEQYQEPKIKTVAAGTITRRFIVELQVVILIKRALNTPNPIEILIYRTRHPCVLV
jgi:hypothetical protein